MSHSHLIVSANVTFVVLALGIGNHERYDRRHHHQQVIISAEDAAGGGKVVLQAEIADDAFDQLDRAVAPLSG